MEIEILYQYIKNYINKIETCRVTIHSGLILVNMSRFNLKFNFLLSAFALMLERKFSANRDINTLARDLDFELRFLLQRIRKAA